MPLRQQGHSFIRFDHIMTLLSASEAKTAKLRTYRYFVHLISSQLDHYIVPESCCIVDVVVLDDTFEALKTVIAAASWLSGYTIVAYWIPSDCAEF